MQVTDNTFIRNVGKAYGGAISIRDSIVNVTGNNFTACVGGAIAASTSTFTLTHSSIIELENY